MAKRNQVQFQKGMSLSTFLQLYGTEEKCAEALAKLRWPSGFDCPSCGCARHCRLERRDTASVWVALSRRVVLCRFSA